MRLHGYYRSTAAWRVRIALGLKGIAAEQAFRHLRKGEQRAPDFLKINPQGLVPALELDSGIVLTQSLAICEYLDETHPAPPLLPRDPVLRAQVRAFSQAIAAEIHAVQNLKILNRLRALGHGDAEVNAWGREVIEEGLAACEILLATQPGPFCFGAAPSLADLCLVPQLFNARRFQADSTGWKRLLQAEAACMALPAFSETAPDRQPDSE